MQSWDSGIHHDHYDLTVSDPGTPAGTIQIQNHEYTPWNSTVDYSLADV